MFISLSKFDQFTSNQDEIISGLAYFYIVEYISPAKMFRFCDI